MRTTLASALLLLVVACSSDDPKTVADASVGSNTPSNALNGCDPAAATDLTATGAARTVAFGGATLGLTYSPSCIKIKVGQTVTFNGAFATHPLAPGIVVPSMQAPPGNPVTPVSTGTTTTVTFPTAGSWGYYCTVHAPGMSGLVVVVP